MKRPTAVKERRLDWREMVVCAEWAELLGYQKAVVLGSSRFGREASVIKRWISYGRQILSYIDARGFSTSRSMKRAAVAPSVLPLPTTTPA